jgi:hypothetical protein
MSFFSPSYIYRTPPGRTLEFPPHNCFSGGLNVLQCCPRRGNSRVPGQCITLLYSVDNSNTRYSTTATPTLGRPSIFTLASARTYVILQFPRKLFKFLALQPSPARTLFGSLPESLPYVISAFCFLSAAPARVLQR